ADALADDIPIEFDRMKHWTPDQAARYFESGGTEQPALTGAPLRRVALPLRFLCLHGGGGNAAVSRAQTSKLERLFGEDASFEHLEGPRIFPDDEVDAQLKVRSSLLQPSRALIARHSRQTYFGEGPYYGWYGVDSTDKSSRPLAEKCEDDSVVFTYEVH
ncbi:MAG: hypothetical protein SGPRY_015078, partial [Prymnesium sp.]